VAAPDSFPRQHARTRRFTLGVPRRFSVAPDGGRVVFLRSAGDDPVTWARGERRYGLRWRTASSAIAPNSSAR
jgi:hypothetical protein